MLPGNRQKGGRLGQSGARFVPYPGAAEDVVGTLSGALERRAESATVILAPDLATSDLGRAVGPLTPVALGVDHLVVNALLHGPTVALRRGDDELADRLAAALERYRGAG